VWVSKATPIRVAFSVSKRQSPPTGGNWLGEVGTKNKRQGETLALLEVSFEE
jgi:hypothetical protein